MWLMSERKVDSFMLKWMGRPARNVVTVWKSVRGMFSARLITSTTKDINLLKLHPQKNALGAGSVFLFVRTLPLM